MSVRLARRTVGTLLLCASAVGGAPRRLSGPLLDRFDLVIEVPAVELEALAHAGAGEQTATVRTRGSKPEKGSARLGPKRRHERKNEPERHEVAVPVGD